MSILNLKENSNIVDSIINAIVSGYRDDLLLEELADAVETEKITKDDFTSAVDALKLYSARFSTSIQKIVDSMAQFEFNDKQSIIKNRPMNLAQQVLQDVDGFNKATNEYYADENPKEKEADFKKPQPKEVKVPPTKVPVIPPKAPAKIQEQKK
jgi:hypothetical protein